MRVIFASWALMLAACLSAQPPADPAQAPAEQPKIPPIKTSITVTDTVSAEAPASITVLNDRQLELTPGVNIDDRLRTVPGFTLFRRSSSLVANPTTQGFTMRGIGATGASRSLLLWDGIPANDPFGGWVYWDRFAPQELDRIEISRGASTSLFGDLAMGGALALFSEPAGRHHYQAGYEGGNRNTHEATVGASNLWRNWALSGFARAFTTDGYFIVPTSIRGSADTKARVRFIAANLRLDYFNASNRLFVRIDTLAEDRQNGTTMTNNATGLGSLAANYSHEWRHDQLSVLGYYTQEGFHATFSAVTNNRNTERQTYSQRVPSDGVGGALLWRHAASNWTLLAGADTARVEGTSTDRLVPTGLRVGGGTQLQRGVFAQGDLHFGPANFYLGMREHFTDDTATAPTESSSGVNFFSPSAGFAVGLHRLRLRGSVYRAQRVPTLNELFRVFSAGSTTTLANPNLTPEKMFGAEAGFDLSLGESTRAGLTFYRNDLTGLITNVTLSSGATIIRQRQNASPALARGIEASLRHTWNHWSGDLGFLFADSRYANGLRIPEVPRNQGSGGISYMRSRTMISAGVRAYSMQFDDDLNTFRLPGFAAVQFAAEQHLTANFSARVAIENLLDREYLTALTPTPNIGSPRLWRVGLRWQMR